MLSLKEIKESLEVRFGVAFTGSREQSEGGTLFVVRPSDLAQTIGFAAEIEIGWRSIELTFRPGPYARSLLGTMSGASVEQQAAFWAFAKSAQDDQGELLFRIDGRQVTAGEPWPTTWPDCELRLRRKSIAWGINPAEDASIVRTWSCRLVGLVLALLPLEDLAEAGASEGREAHYLSKRYERSRINRAACIELRGCSCLVCGFNFSDAYGPLGEGFIHIHHVVPISDWKTEKVVDPATDLIPVCPNCHAMLHRSTPPVAPEALRAILNRDPQQSAG